MTRPYDIITVGRDASNDVQINAPTVSRFHLEIVVSKRDGRFFLMDRGSEWGTAILADDGNKIEVRQGFADIRDRILIGDHIVPLADLVARRIT